MEGAESSVTNELRAVSAALADPAACASDAATCAAVQTGYLTAQSEYVSADSAVNAGSSTPPDADKALSSLGMLSAGVGSDSATRRRLLGGRRLEAMTAEAAASTLENLQGVLASLVSATTPLPRDQRAGIKATLDSLLAAQLAGKDCASDSATYHADCAAPTAKYNAAVRKLEDAINSQNLPDTTAQETDGATATACTTLSGATAAATGFTATAPQTSGTNLSAAVSAPAGLVSARDTAYYMSVRVSETDAQGCLVGGKQVDGTCEATVTIDIQASQPAPVSEKVQQQAADEAAALGQDYVPPSTDLRTVGDASVTIAAAAYPGVCTVMQMPASFRASGGGTGSTAADCAAGTVHGAAQRVGLLDRLGCRCSAEERCGKARAPVSVGRFGAHVAGNAAQVAFESAAESSIASGNTSAAHAATQPGLNATRVAFALDAATHGLNAGDGVAVTVSLRTVKRTRAMRLFELTSNTPAGIASLMLTLNARVSADITGSEFALQPAPGSAVLHAVGAAAGTWSALVVQVGSSALDPFDGQMHQLTAVASATGDAGALALALMANGADLVNGAEAVCSAGGCVSLAAPGACAFSALSFGAASADNGATGNMPFVGDIASVVLRSGLPPTVNGRSLSSVDADEAGAEAGVLLAAAPGKRDAAGRITDSTGASIGSIEHSGAAAAGEIRVMRRAISLERNIEAAVKYVVTDADGAGTGAATTGVDVVGADEEAGTVTFCSEHLTTFGSGSDGSSDGSNSSCSGVVPTAPQNATAVSTSKATVLVTWVVPMSSCGSDINGYSVSFSSGNATAPTTVTAAANATAALITGLSTGTTYAVYVTATNGYGSGDATPAMDVAPVSNTDTTLATLALSSNIAESVGTSPPFDAATAINGSAYEAAVSFATTVATITATAGSEYSSVAVSATDGDGPGIVLAVGENAVAVAVTAENGAVATYTVLVTRLPNSDASLAALNFTSSNITIAPAYSAEMHDYDALCPNSVTTVILQTFAADANAGVSVTDGNTVSVSTGAAAQHSYEVPTGNTILTVTVTAQDGATTQDYTITVRRAAPLANSDATLQTLTVHQAGSDTPLPFSPSFSAGTVSYTMTVFHPVDSINIVAEHMASTSVSTGSGTHALAVGDSSFPVVVTAEDGMTTKTYTLLVTRPPDSNAQLAALSLGAGVTQELVQAATGATGFLSSQTSYTTTVPYSVSATNLTYSKSDTAAEAVVTAPAGGNLAVGANELVVSVTAEDGVTVLQYIVTVTRLQSDDASLAVCGLANSGTDIAFSFDADTTSYAINVPNTVWNVTLSAEASFGGASVSAADADGNSVSFSGVGGVAIALQVGTTALSVVVTAADSTTARVYSLAISRSQPDASAEATLASMAAGSGCVMSPAFESTVEGYSCTVANDVTALVITATPSHFAAVAAITGGGGLIAGSANNVVVTVTAEDGTAQHQYTLVVTRAQSSDARLSALTTDAGALAPAVGINDAAGTSYRITVPATVSSIAFSPTTAEENAAVAPTAFESLPIGESTLALTVTAQDGTTTREYSVVVTRESSNDATLVSCLLKDAGTGSPIALSPSFSPAVTEYTATAAGTTRALTVLPAVNEAHATTVVAQGATVPRDFNVTVTVTAQDGATTRVYTIRVTRPASTDATLSAIGLAPAGSSLAPAFSPATFAYSADVPYSVAALSAVGTASDAPFATAATTSSSTLETSAAGTYPAGNRITVSCTAEDGLATASYVVDVRRAQDTVSTLSALILRSGQQGAGSGANLTLSPTFDPAVTSYTISGSVWVSEVDTLFVTATKTSPASSAPAPQLEGLDAGGGDVMFEIDAFGAPLTEAGNFTLTVPVVAEDGTTTTIYSVAVTVSATAAPTSAPTETPTAEPTQVPTATPTATPTTAPTAPVAPTAAPTTAPTSATPTTSWCETHVTSASVVSHATVVGADGSTQAATVTTTTSETYCWRSTSWWGPLWVLEQARERDSPWLGPYNQPHGLP
jgi:hypothetical protein